MAASSNGSGNIVDEFEEAFQQCLNVLTRDEGQGNNISSGGPTTDKDEVRGEVEQVTLRFLDMARQMEAFFLQKRFLLSTLKPEIVVKEDITELKIELARKEDLIKRHYEKITVWQNLLADLQANFWTGLANGAAQGVQNQQAGGNGATPTMQQQQQMLQQQQLQQQMHQHQMQQQQLHQQQVQQGSGTAPPGMQAVGVNQQGMFMGQGGARAAGFPVGNVGSVQSPLAYLEKTTSNIGMPERRS